MNNYCNYERTMELLNEENERLEATRNKPTLQNKFTTKPQGIIITDSYNNPFFPVQPTPRIDTSKLDLAELYRRFRELYLQQETPVLPWHFCIELVDDRYFVFNTRPLDMKFPITSQEARDSYKNNWDDVTEMFFDENIFDISEAIHICIVGNSKTDVYTLQTYSIIGNFCITPIIRQNRIPSALYQRIFGLNLGGRFKLDNITKFIKS